MEEDEKEEVLGEVCIICNQRETCGRAPVKFPSFPPSLPDKEGLFLQPVLDSREMFGREEEHTASLTECPPDTG